MYFPEEPSTPQEFLMSWSASRGNLRHFLEDRIIPPASDSHQQRAGEAAVAEAFGLNPDDFDLGLLTVSGAFEAAGSDKVTQPDPTIPQDVTAAAFFDVDNTLIQGASMLVFVMGLIRKRYVNVRVAAKVAWQQARFRFTGNENIDAVNDGRQHVLDFVQGQSVEELQKIAGEIVDKYFSGRVWPGTRALAEQHLTDGQQVWLVSATPVQLAQIMAQRFGFTGALGTVPETRNGRFTGRLVGDILHGPGKRHAIAALAAVEGLDLSRCTAYSDSINDLPLLSMVGVAVAVNPDRKLRKVAEQRGWEIIDYRNVRKAVRKFGIPAICAAALSMWVKKRNLSRS